jgi:transposase
MTCQTLTAKERKALEQLATRTTDAQQLRRGQALLWLDQGDTVQEVADHLRLSRQAIYKWVAQFHSRPACEITRRVAPGARSGRPRTAHGVIDPLIAAVIERDPRDCGYRSTVWTAPLLTQ